MNQLDIISGGMRIGYARVSTNEQRLDLQIDALMKNGCARIYQEHVSGAKTQRVELDNALKALRPGDTLVVWRLDRLGRSTKHLIEIAEFLRVNRINLESITENITATGAFGTMIFQFFAMMAEFERNVISERVNEGLKAARARGRKGGRKKALSQAQEKEISILYASKHFTVGDLARKYGVSRPTIYKAIKQSDQKL